MLHPVPGFSAVPEDCFWSEDSCSSSSSGGLRLSSGCPRRTHGLHAVLSKIHIVTGAGDLVATVTHVGGVCKGHKQDDDDDYYYYLSGA